MGFIETSIRVVSTLSLFLCKSKLCEAFTYTENVSVQNPDYFIAKECVPRLVMSNFGRITPQKTRQIASVSRAFASPSMRFTFTRSPSIISLYSTSKDEEIADKSTPPEILPFDPKYSTHGHIGNGTFVIQREGDITLEELSNENLLRILNLNCTDLEVNTLVWKGLGYRFDPKLEVWDNSKVFPKWREKFPSPPDLIGMQRIYTKEIDQPSLKSNQQLVKSVPADNKQSLKVHLKPLGFKGYQYKELTPNKTRRAQCANWLLYFREELFGYTLEELKERRAIKRAQLEKEEEERKKREGRTEDEWKPPVTEVF